jgi:hypothetical protein
METRTRERRAGGDRLAAALMPVVLHGLNNTTQLLASLNALLAIDRSQVLFEGRAGDIAYAARVVDELGWVLAVLASASGADVLLERRRSAGLKPLLETVRDALRRDGSDLELPEILPELEPDVGRGWELPWAVASWLWTARRTSQAEFTWSIDSRGEHCRVACSGGEPAAMHEVSEAIAARLPESRFELDDGAQRCFLVPARWLVAPGARA